MIAFSVVFVLVVVIHLLMPSIVNPTLPFGVRIPASHSTDAVIAVERRNYRIGVVVISILIAGMAAAANVAIGDTSVVPLGIMLLVAGCWAIYYRAHRRLQNVKAREGWYSGLRQGAVVDTEMISAPSRVHWIWALPALAILVGTALVGIVDYASMPSSLAIHVNANGSPTHYVAKSVWTAFSPVFGQGFLTILAGLMVFIPLSRQDLDAEHPVQSARQSRVFQQTLFKGLLVVSAGVNLTLLVTSFEMWHVITTSSTVSTLGLAPALIGVAILVIMMLQVGQGGFRVAVDHGSEQGTGVVNRDDDRFWLGGVLYVNRHDPAFLVTKRFGVGWTLNWGHPVAWIFGMAVIAIIVLSRH